MSYDGRQVANFILDCCDEFDRPITHLALQKIVYFCHVWSLIELGRPLIRHKFEAWEHGPVLQYLYREFRGSGKAPIRNRAKNINKNTGAKETTNYDFEYQTHEMLLRVIRFYSQLTPSQLRELSHVAGGPWDKAWNHNGKTNPGMKIDDDEIASFYSKVPPPVTIQ